MESLLIKADKIMQGMGFPAATGNDGLFVSQLRDHIAMQVSHGMVGRSGGTWATDDIWRDHEERARCILEVDWEIEHGHTRRVNLIDTAPIMRRFDTRAMRWRWEFRPRLIRPWIEDRLSAIGMWWRGWRDRNVKNPYSRHS